MISRISVFWKFNYPAIFWSAFILILCGLPGSDFPDMSAWRLLSFDKFVHFILFAILSLVTIKGLKKQYAIKILKFNAVTFSLLWAAILGIGSEILQDFIFIGRNADIYDVIANLAGALAGFIGFLLIFGRENTFRYS